MICPVCLENTAPAFIEEHTDSISGQAYKIFFCPGCEVVFSEPMRLPSADWYYRAFPHKEAESALKLRWEYKKFLNDKIRHEGKLLDIGCGSGNFLLLAQKIGYQVSGIDFDARQVEKARDLGLNDVSEGSLDSFCAKRKNEKFNVITLFGMLEHVDEPDRFVKKISEMLYADGKIAIALPNNNRLVTFVREIHDYPPHHFSRWTKRSLIKFLEKRGFHIITIDDSTLSLYCIKINILSWLKKIFLRRSNNPLSNVRDETGTGFLIKYYRLINEVYLVGITPFAAIFWLIFKISKPNSGSDIYALAQLNPAQKLDSNG